MHYDLSPAMVAAAQLMEQQRFAECAAAYEHIVKTQPADAPLAAMQVGAANFFLGRFDLAEQWYGYAGTLGWSPEDVAGHVQEAREARQHEAQRQGGSQYAVADGVCFVNVGGAGWVPLTAPRAGEVVLSADGGMWTLSLAGTWFASANHVSTPAPAAGDKVYVVGPNQFFVLQHDGTWTLST